MQDQRNAMWRRVPVWMVVGMWFLIVTGGWPAPCAAGAEEQPKPAIGLPENLTDAEKTAILREDSPQDRVERCLKLGALRLAQAQEAIQREDYPAANQAMEIYVQLLSYAQRFAREAPIKDKKRDQIYRVMETTLRRQLPILESLTRECPESLNNLPQLALSQVHETRKQLLNAVFGGEFLKVEEASPRAPEH